MNRRAASVVASLLVLVISAFTPAHAAHAAPRELNATANGRAEAAAVFVPFRVNPNFEFYPAYSFSSIANSASQSSSHGVSAGFYPGFLLDAFMDFYGFRGPGRALLGFAETQYPDPPQTATSSTADFGTLCKESGSNEQITQYFPRRLFDGCQQFYSALTGGFGGSLPYRMSAGHSESGFLSSTGYADGFQMRLPMSEALTIGHAHSTSSTTAESAHATVSVATSVLRDVIFGDLRISEIHSSVRVSADAKLGPKAERTVQIVGASLAGRPVTIDENGMRPVTDNAQARSLIDRFAEQGFDVKLVHGHESVDPDSGEVTAISGGLALRLVRGGTPPELRVPTDELCTRTTDLQDPDENGNNPVLTPGSIRTFDYDLAALPPVNDAYQKLWDENYPLGLVLPRDIEGSEPVPPVIPCAGVLFDRAVDAGVVLGVTAASARFVEGLPLPDLGDVFTPGVPDRVFTTTTTIPGVAPGTGLPPGLPGIGPVPPVAAPGPEFGADVARLVKLLYGAMVLLLAGLVGGRAAFRRLVRT